MKSERRILKLKPLFRKCKLCGESYDILKAKNIFVHPFCPAWPVYKHGERVSLNMYDAEMEMEQEIASAWEMKARSIAVWERHDWSGGYKIRCWYCNEWFLSDSNMPASCFKCATIKEETP